MHIYMEEQRERFDVAVKFARAGTGQDQVKLCLSGNWKADLPVKYVLVPHARSEKPALPSPSSLSAIVVGTEAMFSRSSR